MVIVLVACTSEALPEITSDSVVPPTSDAPQATEDSGGADDKDLSNETRARSGAPADASIRSLLGTSWELLEAFNVEVAYLLDQLTFSRANGENHLEVTSDCGTASGGVVELPNALRIVGFSASSGNRCLQRDSFFHGDLEAEIDPLGRLTLRHRGGRVDDLLRFTYVESASINTDELPALSVGELTAFQIGRSRWNVAKAIDAAVSEDGLEQSVGFTTVSANADVLSFYSGCRGVSKEISWQDDGSFVVGAPFQFLTPSIKTPECTDRRQGIAARLLPPGATIAVDLIDANTLVVRSGAAGDSWSFTATREVPPEGVLPDCVDFTLGSVVDETYMASERLPDGTQSMVTFDGFDVVKFEGMGSDVDGDGEWNPIQVFTLRDPSGERQVDVGLCSLPVAQNSTR